MIVYFQGVMNGIVSYKTPQDYLNATENFLLQHELENNLILGLCYGFPDRTKAYANTVFVNVMRGDEALATSIKTWAKAIVFCETGDQEHVKKLAEYYLDNSIPIAGVVGKNTCAEQFLAHFKKPESQRRTMLVHQLTTLNEVPLSNGSMMPATEDDAELITDWTVNFEEDAGSFPKHTKEVLMQSTKSRLSQGNLFKWVVQGEPVSLAAIVRRTKNIGIVGLVYTPERHRGKGYATSCVQKLSEHILQTGYRYCGLFTDKSNPTSNGIYRRIGYEPVSEFSDIEF